MPPWPGSWPLRSRLLVMTVLLLATVSLVVGSLAVASLERGLTARLDQQLAAAAGRVERGPAAGGPGRGDSPVPGWLQRGPRAAALGLPGQGEGTLSVLVTGGGVATSEVVGRTGSRTTVAPRVAAILADVPVDGRPRTLDLPGDVGRYRVVASPLPGGSGAVVTGLPMDLVTGPVSDLTVVVSVVGVTGVLAAAGIGAVILSSALRPLRRMAATATRVAEMRLDRGEVALAERVPEADTDPRTEVGQVGAALNHLLQNVAAALTARQASETRVRRFVADASHELRTPLASIRGYAELTRRSPEAVPGQVAHALARVESEALRMSGLVDDLLLLARLDEGRPVEREPVDLSALVIDAVSDAHAAGPEHRWTLDLPDTPVVVIGDAARLHQVVANLLSNARVHTPAGTTVDVALSVGAGATALRVREDGPGLDEELQAVAFQRFARGDGSRSRAAGSTGLGLAIVAAVTAAHGGSVQLASRPGMTDVTLTLPGPG